MTLRLNPILVRVLGILAALMLVVAVFDMPYGYYTLLGLVVTIVAALFVWLELSKANRVIWITAMGLIALVFNPLIPVYLARETWFFIDLAVAAIFAAYAVTFPQKDRELE